ncbi:MAG TPA: TonB family protein [Candidatus Acidoferrum sp.]|nr:TonB family protein [Candidatus Acidoferrum sp.]
MSSVTITSKDSERTEERRSSPRGTLKRYVVLVFFGEDNWGKLTNMSESGMAIEFAKPPSLRERVNFTFQAMGCMPIPRNEKGLGDCFEAPGEIVWTREFERGAGVQFVDLAEASREQIRQWLSFESSENPSPSADAANLRVQPVLAELLSSLPQGSSAKDVAAARKESWLELEMPVPIAGPVPEPDSAFLKSSAAESDEKPAWTEREETAKGPRAPESPAYSHPSGARLTFLVVSGCLAAFAVTAGVSIFMTRAAHRTDTEVRPPGKGESTAEVHVPSRVPSPVSSPARRVATSPAASAPPFQVDVLDANGGNWILWFVHGGAKDKENQSPYRSAESSNSSTPAMKTTRREESVSPEKGQDVHTFTIVGPNLSHPPNVAVMGNPSAEAPGIETEPTVSSEDPFGGAIGGQTVPAAPALHGPIGGMVQQPRLLRATLPAYPQLAKSSRVGGDVVVDALIDAAGKVTAVRAISGPALLQQAAMDTVRQWNYEPARLDGQAVAMHLSVTVKFRLN